MTVKADLATSAATPRVSNHEVAGDTVAIPRYRCGPDSRPDSEMSRSARNTLP